MVAFRDSILFLLLLLASTLVLADGTVELADCELEGFNIGGSQEKMHQIFGDPKPQRPSKHQPIDIVHRGFQFEGLVLIVGRGDGAMAYQVKSAKHRLRSGLGIGSNQAEVEAALGAGVPRKIGGAEVLSYRIIWNDGTLTAHHLNFTFSGDVVSYFEVMPG